MKIEFVLASPLVLLDVEGFDFNQYEDGIARVTVTATPIPAEGFTLRLPPIAFNNGEEPVSAAAEGDLHFNIHTADFPND